jgi:signal transduction histidine kinase
MSMITTALLALAREKGGIDIQDESGSSEAAIQEQIERYSDIFRHKDIRLKLEIVERPELDFDPAILTMVFGNLLRNAFSYTDAGHILVRLEKNRISVMDDGPGFDTQDLKQLFKPYTRGDKSSGAGLGLSLAWRLCERQGWRLALSNRPEGGAVAEILFDA